MQSAKEAGTRTACAGNLRQLHAALNIYIDDYGAAPAYVHLWLGAQSQVEPLLICPKDHTKGYFMMTGSPRGNPALKEFVPMSYERGLHDRSGL